jgi:hypothetical protein
MSDLHRAFSWLLWKVDRERNAITPMPETGAKRVLWCLKTALALTSPQRDVVIDEAAFSEHLVSVGADGPAIMGECFDRGWIKPIVDDGEGRKLSIDGTRLVEDADEFAADDKLQSEPEASKTDWAKTTPPPAEGWHPIPITDTMKNLAVIVGCNVQTLKGNCAKGIAWIRRTETGKYEMYPRTARDYAKFNSKQMQTEG